MAINVIRSVLHVLHFFTDNAVGNVWTDALIVRYISVVTMPVLTVGVTSESLPFQKTEELDLDVEKPSACETYNYGVLCVHDKYIHCVMYTSKFVIRIL